MAIHYISPLTSPLFDRSGPRALSILGSTGSIGVSALRVVAKNPDAFRVVALAGARNVELLAEQALRFRPELLGVLDPERASALKTLLPSDYRPDIVNGQNGFRHVAALRDADLVLAAQVGAAGLAPALAAADAGKVLCLANKEALVLAGHLFRQACAKSGAVILPVDSEHNALFQALAGRDAREVSRLILTASGGPFRDKSAAEMATVTPEQALRHPNWSMGAKISIDSATMMNKGLEIIEAVHLFGATEQDIEVLVHPQSIVHSLVEYTDGSHLAHLGVPNMEIPIGYCLGYPHLLHIGLERLDLTRIGALTFSLPDEDRFPCLRLAREALRHGPDHTVALNAANEIGVQAFLKKHLSFPGIARLIDHILATHTRAEVDTPEAILRLDATTRARATAFVTEGSC